MYVATDVTSAFRFKPDVRAELKRKADLAGCTMTEYLTRMVMSDAMPPDPFEHRIAKLEARLNNLVECAGLERCAR